MHSRLTAIATTAAAAAVAVTGVALPAHAEAVVYDSYGVQSNPPDRPGHRPYPACCRSGRGGTPS